MKFIVRRYDMWPDYELEKEIDRLYSDGYYPTKIELGGYQEFVSATIIYEKKSNVDLNVDMD